MSTDGPEQGSHFLSPFSYKQSSIDHQFVPIQKYISSDLQIENQIEQWSLQVHELEFQQLQKEAWKEFKDW